MFVFRNAMQNNNLRLKGLIEGTEGEYLKAFLENLFMACLGSNSNTEILLQFAYRLMNARLITRRRRDLNVLIGFPDGTLKAMVIDVL